MSVLVALHPETVPGDPQCLRWVVPVGTLVLVGAVRAAPAPLQQLLDDGTLAEVAVEPAGVRTRLGEGRSWRAEGGRVREALQPALSAPEQWTGVVPSTPDDALRMAVQQVIDGAVGDYVRSHGGAARLVEVRDGAVVLSLSGACDHCPASGLTLSGRFETAVRALHPALRSVTAHTEAPPSDGSPTGGRRLLGLTPLRRR